MTTADYIDWDEGRDFAAAPSAAVDRCENCGRTGQRLTRVPEFDYMGCDDCMEEALAVIAREEEGRDPIGWEGGFAANH
jgi:hypothetical protein